jgi:hypothetical protein
LAKLQNALATVTGQRVQIEFSLDEEMGEAARPEPRRPISQRQLQQEYARRPFVAKAMEQFRAQITHVDPPEV